MADPRSLPLGARTRKLAILAVAACAFPLLSFLVGPEPAPEDSAHAPARSASASPASPVCEPLPSEPALGAKALPLSAAASPTPRASQAASGSSTRASALAWFSGRVLGPEGRPLAGVTLSFSDRGNLGSGEGSTGPDGRFRVAVGVSPNRGWTLTLTPPAQSDFVAREEHVTRPHALGLRSLGDLPLERGWSVSGVVVGPEGDPRPDVEVRLQDRSHELDRSLRSSSVSLGFTQSVDPATGEPEVSMEILEPSRFLPTTTTRADGTFCLRAVPGRAQVLVAERGACRARQNVWPRAPLRGVRLVLDEGLSLEVAVQDEEGRPLAGASVVVTGEEGDQTSALSDSKGIARLPPIAGEHAEFVTQAPGHLARRGVLVRPPGRALLRITQTLPRVRVLTGRCTSEGVVWVHPRQGGPHVLATRETPEAEAPGSFRVEDLQPGVHDVLLQRDRTWFVLAEGVLIGHDSLDLGDLEPTPLHPLRLRVLDHAGEPLIGVVLVGPGGLPSPTTNASGRCELSLPPGRHRYSLEEPKQARLVGAPLAVATSFALSPPLQADAPERVLRALPPAAWLRVQTPTSTPDALPEVAVVRLGEGPDLGQAERVCHVARAGPLEVPLARGGRFQVYVDGYLIGTYEVPSGTKVEVPYATDLCSVEVRVVDASGNPLPGIEGTVDRPTPFVTLATPLTRGEAWTDQAGWLRTRLRLGRGQREVVLTLVHHGRTSRHLLPVQGSQIHTTLQLGLSQPQPLTLFVPDGRPGEWLRLLSLSRRSANLQLTTLDARRLAHFPALTPGTYRVALEGRAFPDPLRVVGGRNLPELTLQGRGTTSRP